MKKIIAVLAIFCSIQSIAQNVGIGTLIPDPSAQLEVQSIARGFLIPKMTALQRGGIGTPAFGLLIFQTDAQSGFYYNAGTPALPNWIRLSDGSTGWNVTGNAGTNPLLNFLGTTDNVALKFRVNNEPAGKLDPANKSYFIGRYSGNNVITGNRNAGFGDSALAMVTNGSGNTAVGASSLRNNSTGVTNVAIGDNALFSNQVSDNNVAVGDGALYHNGLGVPPGSEASGNTAVGSQAIFKNINGANNSAIGAYSLFANINGHNNSALGAGALVGLTGGNLNTGIGAYGLNALGHGYGNMGMGFMSATLTKGSNNILFGNSGAINTRLDSVLNNVIIGSRNHFALRGNSNVFLGYNTGGRNVDGNNNVALGDSAYGSIMGVETINIAHSNVAIGSKALAKSFSQSNLVAVGDSSLFNNGVGVTDPFEAIGNTAVGSKALFNNTRGSQNTALGIGSLYNNVTGTFNSAFGSEALRFLSSGNSNLGIGDRGLGSLTAGGGNIGLGFMSTAVHRGSGNIVMGSSGATGSSPDSVLNNIILGSRAGLTVRGSRNILLGYLSGGQNVYGSGNVAMGDSALATHIISEFVNLSHSNVAIGSKALAKNFTHSNLVAVGDSALFNNGAGGTTATQSIGNTAIGSKSLLSNISGRNNTALGNRALLNNVEGNGNIAIGVVAMVNSMRNSENIAIGDSALFSYNDGILNDSMVAVGFGALRNNTIGYYNTAIGSAALSRNVDGYRNTALGANAGARAPSLFNTTALGNNAVPTTNNQVMLGNTSVTSVVAAGSFVIYSDGRFKKGIKEDVPGLEFINALRPVTYQYDIRGLNTYIGAGEVNDRNNERNAMANQAIASKEQKLYTGFIAQEVEKTASKLGYEFSGLHKPQNDKDPYGLSYADFVVPLVKAVQEQQVLIDKQNQIIEELKKRLEALEVKSR